MKKYKSQSKINKNKKIILLLVAIVLVAIISFIALHKTGKISLFSQNNTTESNTEDKEAQTTSNTPTAQAEYSEGDEREPGNTVHENRGSSAINDTQGNIPSGISTNQPISSNSGEITVYSPVKESLLRSGQVVAGASTLPRVTYRVIDNVSGMIAMGELSVVNGKFSGTIDFDTSSQDGRLDIFATRPDGSEYSVIEVPIRFR
ncbi:hypothetical protein KC867_03810 [Candidatus Saccharibacteria bacterium]|nr:hypothetical protein [Candidatus Saccharibacteria bacterium]